MFAINRTNSVFGSWVYYVQFAFLCLYGYVHVFGGCLTGG
jgi:hypothetical protein